MTNTQGHVEFIHNTWEEGAGESPPGFCLETGGTGVKECDADDDVIKDARAEGYRRGWDVATSRAQSRRELGLAIE